MSYGVDPQDEDEFDEEDYEARQLAEDEHWDSKFDQLRDDAMEKEVEIACNRSEESGAARQESDKVLGEIEDTARRGIDDREDHLVFDTSQRLESMWRREPKNSGGRFRSERR